MNGILEGRRIFVTCGIDYANGPPHLGHAFEKIGADALVRYLRLKNIPVRFSIGMDEHGLKVLQSAEAAGITRAGLYKALGEDGNPSFATVVAVLKALGVKLSAKPAAA